MVSELRSGFFRGFAIVQTLAKIVYVSETCIKLRFGMLTNFCALSLLAIEIRHEVWFCPKSCPPSTRWNLSANGRVS